MKYFIDGKYYFEALQVQDPPHYIQQCFQIHLTQIAYLFGLGQHLPTVQASGAGRSEGYTDIIPAPRRRRIGSSRPSLHMLQVQVQAELNDSLLQEKKKRIPSL